MNLDGVRQFVSEAVSNVASQDQVIATLQDKAVVCLANTDRQPVFAILRFENDSDEYGVFRYLG